jgi:putative transposase
MHLYEVFVKINGETHYLWRAIDHEGAVLEALVFPKKIMKRYGRPRAIVTDRLRSYRAAMKLIGNNQIREVGRWMNNRCENYHLPFRRQEYAMLRFRHMRSLQKFISIHSSVFNHFNKERHLNSRDIFKVQREAALFKWQ